QLARAGRALLAPPPGRLAAELVGQPPRRDLDQPRARVLGEALPGPLGGCGEQGLLDGVLAGVEPAVPTDECAEHPRGVLAEELFDARVDSHISIPPDSITGRTSIALNFASGICAASSAARSTVSQSTT